MKEIQVIPLQSAVDVNFGWTRKEAHKKIGHPDRTREKTDHYQKGLPMFSVDYDFHDRVEYISISNPKNAGIKILYYGLDVFETPANELIARIEKSTGLRYDRNDPELEYSFVFLDIDLSFWRPVLPEDENDEDGKYFETIGIGKKGYYRD